MLLVSKTITLHAVAACNSSAPLSGTSVTCTGSSFAPVIARSGSANVTVNVASGASGSFVHASSAVVLSVEQNSAVTSNGTLTLTGGGGTGTQRGAVLLGTGNGNQLTNASGATINTTGAFNDAMAANGSGNTLTNLGTITTTGPSAYGMTAAWGQTNVGQLNNTLVNAGSVSTAGSNARAASILGGSGTISNSGSLSTSGAMSPAAYMQGNNDHLLNTGSIDATGQGSDAVFSNTASSSFNALIENRAGGRIVSQNAAAIRTLNGSSTVINAGLVQSGVGTAISMGGGNDMLILQTGSTIVGSADGGTGANTVTLQGSGTAANAFVNFQTLLVQGTLWNWSGSGTFATAHVQSGTLALTGTLNAPASVATTIDAGATIVANAQNLPLNVVDNGLVNFAQEADGAYSGLISGTGAVQKNGAGALTLAPSAASGNTYSGGTLIAGGVVAIAADNALGASTGGLAFDGGTLQLNRSFDLAATRAMTLNAGGGTIDTQTFDSTLAQPVTGSGALIKAGAGTLLMNGVSTYSGSTTVTAGTLAIGDPAHTNAELAGGGGMNIDAGTTVGGYGAVSGAVTNNGTLAVANALPAFAAASNGTFSVNGTLTNAALVQIAGPAGTTPGNVLRVAGNYVGQDGAIVLNTVVGADEAPSDRLVIDGGSASGSTVLQVANAGGTGAQTAVNGIRVIEAANGAATDPSAFRLSAPIKAGAYTYYLAKGGVTAGSANDWFLRNTVAPLPVVPQTVVPPSAPGTPPVAPPSEPGTPPSRPGAPPSPPPSAPGAPPSTPPSSPPEVVAVPIAAAGTPPLPAPPPAGSDPIPLYRPEVPLYAAIPGVARQLGVFQIDTFHDRQGDQSVLTGRGALPAAWARTWGNRSVLAEDGAASPEFDGSTFGVQAGHDLYADASANGARNHYGLLLGFARATGSVNGFALGSPNLDVGHLAINAYSVGGYWTHVAANGWYTDMVVMGSSLTVDPQSSDGAAVTTHGHGVAASVEGGLPFALPGSALAIEPQAQLTWQHLSLNDFNDGVSSVSFNSGNTFVGRVGVRLQGRFSTAGAYVEPWLRASVLRAFGSDDRTTFAGSTVIGTTIGQTSVQIGAGVVAQVAKSASVYATVGWLTNLGGAHQRTIGGSAGVRWTW
ncbi:autotransporter outer membrane beta-barrel domain-containing protein [Paraburkholderia edwinii]|uniref:Autotransporter outer membrane beta-barrel domain-containing protein n=1 Tax=Paraburkholderia edwinii TaxID=2861782 RepID=A0ABX8UYA7_9BURK|nr:autotransporter outer membrane beta-barrel domain-containing protein [Paraburkholderia edwinii]